MNDTRILEHQVMVTSKFVVVVAAAALWCWCSAAMAQSPRTVDGLTPVACNSPSDLYKLLDAADRKDAGAQARLVGRSCENLADRRYEVVAQKNGIVTIRLFPHDGDRAGSRLAVTLDEMVDPDLFPGSETQPTPAS
jgi:hypothetical protein